MTCQVMGGGPRAAIFRATLAHEPRIRRGGVYWPWYLSGRAVRAKRRRQTNFRRHSKCPLLKHLRCANQRRNELMTGNQNANTDPPEVANKLITPTNSNPGSGGNPD